MARFLIDVNLPARLSIWRGDEFIHVRDLDDRWTDSQIWSFARLNQLTIVSKDADFAYRMAVLGPPPRVVHICVGNMPLRELRACLLGWWPWILANSEKCSMIRVHKAFLEAVMDDPQD